MLCHASTFNCQLKLEPHSKASHEGEIVDLIGRFACETNGVTEQTRPGHADVRGELPPDLIARPRAQFEPRNSSALAPFSGRQLGVNVLPQLKV
jgi:hypothetical protein